MPAVGMKCNFACTPYTSTGATVVLYCTYQYRYCVDTCHSRKRMRLPCFTEKAFTREKEMLDVIHRGDGLRPLTGIAGAFNSPRPMTCPLWAWLVVRMKRRRHRTLLVDMTLHFFAASVDAAVYSRGDADAWFNANVMHTTFHRHVAVEVYAHES